VLALPIQPFRKGKPCYESHSLRHQQPINLPCTELWCSLFKGPSRLGILLDLESVTGIDLNARPSLLQALWYNSIISSVVPWGCTRTTYRTVKKGTPRKGDKESGVVIGAFHGSSQSISVFPTLIFRFFSTASYTVRTFRNIYGEQRSMSKQP